jgi:hypothetical protein
MSYSVGGASGTGHTRLSFRVMSVRRAGLSATGDKREEVERRAGRNNLPERKDMMTDDGSVESVGDGPACASYKAIYKGLRSMPYAITAALRTSLLSGTYSK